jgi:hypothetical protein
MTRHQNNHLGVVQPQFSPEEVLQKLIQELLKSTGLTETLAEALIKDQLGRSFEPVQLTLRREFILTQMELLLRRQAVGGAESIIRENEEQMLAFARLEFFRWMGIGAQNSSTPLIFFLQELLNQTSQLKANFEARQEKLAEKNSHIEERLHKWQDWQEQPHGDTIKGLLLGQDGNLPLPRVAHLWNHREHLALARQASDAALQIVTQFRADVTFVQEHLDILRNQANNQAQANRQRIEELSRPTGYYQPFTWRVDEPTIAQFIAQQVNAEAHVTELLQKLLADEANGLADYAHQIAQREAEQRLAPLTINRLIELEAHAIELKQEPLLLMGNDLRQRLKRPTWQLTSRAAPRLIGIQITPDGSEIYANGPVAATDERIERMGFLVLEAEVGLDELRFLQIGQEGFQKAQQQHNYYVLDELAVTWEQQQQPANPKGSIAPQPVVMSTNGARA